MTQSLSPVTLVLLPGLDGTQAFLGPLLSKLPNWILPVVVTYPTSGSQAYADLLLQVQREVTGLNRFHVLGWSFAGPLALMLAAAEPQRVRSVVLSASFVRPPRPLLSKVGFALHGPTIWAWRAARRMPVWLLRPRKDLFRMAKTQTWREVPASVIAQRLRSIRTVDARDTLRALPQRRLYLAAGNDGTVPRHNAEEIRRLKPETIFATIPGGHFAMFTHADAAAQVIARFIRSQAQD